MKRSHALIVLLVLIGSTVVSSLYGYGSAKARVDADLRQALDDRNARSGEEDQEVRLPKPQLSTREENGAPLRQ